MMSVCVSCCHRHIGPILVSMRLLAVMRVTFLPIKVRIDDGRGSRNVGLLVIQPHDVATNPKIFNLTKS
jgi:hypothetical protein